jgi:hypothetical protein
MANDKEIKIEFPANLKGGVYANNLLITHTKEEFMMDFMVLAPPQGTVTARVITSPGHMKRIIKALQENLAKYEASFGKLTESDLPQGPIGFQ